ncbi:hypothetical protein SEA_LOADRIE_106 [Mycobacterium phage Loadrie]|nr:hypothetical protein SEA_LOADRIE_106 [Mycobacterium phage Loadrie]QDH92608.1 hypothetical protein SEA_WIGGLEWIGGLE_106 [Mycobacterium phage Wigglewiggle]
MDEATLGRVTAEWNELVGRIGRLIAFRRSERFADLSDTAQHDLAVQLVFMQGYRDVLGKRIERATGVWPRL